MADLRRGGDKRTGESGQSDEQVRGLAIDEEEDKDDMDEAGTMDDDDMDDGEGGF